MEAQLSAAGSHWPVFQEHIFRFQLSLAPFCSSAQVPGAVTAAAGTQRAQWASFEGPLTLLVAAMLGKWLWCCTREINTFKAVRILVCCSELCLFSFDFSLKSTLIYIYCWLLARWCSCLIIYFFLTVQFGEAIGCSPRFLPHLPFKCC